MKAHIHPLDIVFRLAEDHGIVLLNGGGFEAPNWSVRGLVREPRRRGLRRHRSRGPRRGAQLRHGVPGITGNCGVLGSTRRGLRIAGHGSNFSSASFVVIPKWRSSWCSASATCWES